MRIIMRMFLWNQIDKIMRNKTKFRHLWRLHEACYKMLNGFIYGEETQESPVLVLFRLIKDSLLFTRIGTKRLQSVYVLSSFALKWTQCLLNSASRVRKQSSLPQFSKYGNKDLGSYCNKKNCVDLYSKIWLSICF